MKVDFLLSIMLILKSSQDVWIAGYLSSIVGRRTVGQRWPKIFLYFSDDKMGRGVLHIENPYKTIGTLFVFCSVILFFAGCLRKMPKLQLA